MHRETIGVVLREICWKSETILTVL